MRCDFDGFQIVSVSIIAKFFFQFCCFVYDVNHFKVKFAVYYAITNIVYDKIIAVNEDGALF